MLIFLRLFSSSNVEEVTLNRLSLDVVFDGLRNRSHFRLASEPLDDADDADDCNDCDEDDEAEDEVGIAFISRASNLLNDNSLHLGDNLATLVNSDDSLGAIILSHNLGSRRALSLLLSWSIS